MTETITDEDALGIQQELVATPDPARKAQLAGVLSVYRQQQEDAGRLQFEGIEEKQRLRDRNVRNMFSDPTTLGLPPVEQEALKERMKVSPNPEGERKVYANTVWLAHQLQAPYEKVAEAYPIARDNFADQVYGGAGKGSDEAFYAATRAHIAQQETVDEAARAGYSAALTGEDRVTTLAAAQQGKPDQWKDEHTKAFAAGYEQAQSVIGPHRALVADLTAALERSMKGGAKKEDEDAIAQAKEKLVDMPVQTRRIALQALALAAKKAGKDAEKGTTLGTDWFAPVVKPVTGWFQEAGEAGGRFLSGGFSGTAKAQDLIEAVPDQGEAIVDGKLETPDDARRYVEEQAKARRVYSERGSQFVPRGTKTTLTPAQSELIRVAKSRAKRELTLDRQLARLAEETDPVGNVTASAFGTSVAALGIVGLTGPGVLPIMAGMYSNIEYDKLRMNYPELSHGQAQAIAGISGGLQAAADLIGFRVLRTLPGLKSFLSQDITRVLVTRAAIRFGVEQATQTGVEVLQDYTTGLVQDAYAALSRDVPSHDWSKEVPFWEDVGWNFIGMLPLTLLGIGISSVQEARGLQALLSNNRELGRSGVVAADRVKIVDLAAQGKADEAQEALVTAWEGRSPVVARQFGNEAEARRIELETALDAAARLGLLPRIQRTEAGYTITAPDGTAVTVKDRVEAVNLATQYADDLERKRQEAILEGFEAISRGEDILDYDPAREGTLKAGQADPAGGWTEEQATQAAIVQGTLMGMSEEEARATTWAVLGHNQVERAETVRDGVATLVNVSKTKLNAGANVLTAVEEAVHGNWTRGVTEGAWTPQEGLQWVRLGERLLGEELLPMSDAEALTQLRALSEAISALVVADAVGRRKDGSRVLSGAVTRGLTAEMQRAKQQDRGAVGKLRQFLLSWRTLFGQVFRRARQLAKARKEGKVGADFDAFLDQMLSTDPQARHERGVAREVEAMAEDAGMPFSLAPEGGWQYPRPSKYSVPRTDAEAAGNALLEPGERLTDAQLLAVKRATSYYLPEYYNKAGYLKMVAAGGGLKSGLDPAKLWEESEAFHPAARAAADAFAEAHKPTYQTEAQRLALKGNYKYPSSFSKPILRVRSLKPGDRIGEYGGKIGPSGQSERIVAKVEMNTRSAGKDVPAIVYLDDGSELHLTSQSPIVRYGNTSDIQREKTPATKGTTTQTGEGAIQGEGQVEFQFSLAPRDLLDRVSARLQSHLRKPEAREAFYKLAKERLARIRADSTTWRGDTVEGLDSMAERDRSAASLEREAKVRLRMRQRELIDEGMAGLSRATLAAFHSDAALADARENPIIAYMLKADPATPGGWSGQMLHPSKADERTINEYDDMPGGLPRWFWGRSGGMAPDQMAQELADAGLIADPYPATMWKAIDSAFKTAWETKDAIKSARDAVRKVERDAYAKAKAEADKWLEQAKANVPSGKEKMLAALRVADAILSAFPSEVRGRVGGFYKLASAGSDKGRLNVFLGMLDKLDLLVEKHLKALYSEQFNDVLERGRPGGKPGEGVSGKIGAAAHEWFAGVEKAAQMTREEADERMTEIEALLQEPDLTPEREAELVEEYLLVQEFGAFATRSAAEMETALNDAKEVLQRGRDSWLAVLGERKQLRANIVKQAVREVGNAGKLSDQSKGGKARSASPLAWAADKFVRQLWTWRQTLEATMNRDSAVANRFHDLARQATRTERDAVLRREAEFQDGLKNEVLPGRDRRARNRWLHDLLQPSREISIIEDAKTEKMEVPVSVARAVVDSGNTLAGHDFTDADAERLEAMLAENDARPERNRKEVLKFERVVFGGTRQKIQISEAEAIHLLMTWRQQEYRSGMELHGFDAEAMDEIRDAITPAGYRLMEWIGRQYREGYEPLNAVHARVRGVNLPRVENYAPGVFEHEGEVSEMSLDSPHLQNGNLRSGFTKRRKAHVARVRLDFEHHSVNALSLYWNHVAQVEHWKAWVEAVNEFKTVLRNRDLRGAVMAAHGQEAVNSMNGWLELFENGGLRNGWENQQQARWVNRLMRAKARVSLILRLPVYMVQSTASLTALLDLPAKQGLRSLGRVLAGQGKMSVREAFNHPVIQRRLHGGFSPEARIAKAAKSSSAGKFDKATQALLDKLGAHTTDIDAAMDWGMETIGRTDAAFTSIAAATAYDAHYAQAEALGLSGAAADSYATEKMEETVQRTAQPAEALDRSLAEASPNVFLRLLMMFTSEPRQKIALELGVIRQVLKGQAKISEAARMVFLNHLVLGGMVWLVRSMARDLLNDDDDNGLDDPAWEAADLLYSVILGPFSGIPIIGDAAELVASTVAGKWQFSDSPSPAVGPIKDVITGTKALMKPPGDEEIEHYAKAIGRIARGVAMFIGGNAAAAGVAENIAEQVFQLGDNVVSE